MGTPVVPTSLRSWISGVGEIARAVNAAEPLDDVLARVAEQACALIGFEHCAVMLAEPDREHLRVAGSWGLSQAYVAQVSDAGSLLIHPSGPMHDSPAAAAFRDGRTVVVPDVGIASRYGRLRHLASKQGYRGLIAAPLRAPDSGLVGVLVAYAVAARAFGAQEVELVELLADQAALALETARLRSAQQAVITALSQANNELRRSRAMTEWAEQQHRELMRLVLAEVGLVGLVAALAEALDASVTVEDPDDRLLARAPEHGYHPPPTAAARRRRPVQAALDALARTNEVVRLPAERSGRPGAAAVGHPPGPGQDVWVAPVVLGGELAARLWITNPRAAPEPVERRVIERFALVVALELLKQRSLVDVEERLSGDLVGDLLRPGGPQHPQGVLDRAAALGHDLSRPHHVAVLALDPPGHTDRLTELIRAGAGPTLRPLAGPHQDVHALLLPADPDPGDALRGLLDHLGQALPGRVATIAVGPLAGDLMDHAAAFRVARGAARLRRATQPGGLVDIRELGMAALLLENGTPAALRRFAQGLLRPVAAHDARRGGDLLPTLRSWLAAGCSTAATAQEMVIHPNTVGYRLGRIEKIIGRDLRRVDTRTDLQLALTVRDIVGLGGS
ncbi:helix-turn-helix domain-containing protein [Pseudonocardia sp. GCM10023141]|uniref:helix-turn-helix domain-containing protein n=1 Tax=Pseudonocardia sp. GCM10023141 TaxID=3252653 RepID=UPI003611EB00